MEKISIRSKRMRFVGVTPDQYAEFVKKVHKKHFAVEIIAWDERCLHCVNMLSNPVRINDVSLQNQNGRLTVEIYVDEHVITLNCRRAYVAPLDQTLIFDKSSTGSAVVTEQSLELQPIQGHESMDNVTLTNITNQDIKKIPTPNSVFDKIRAALSSGEERT